LIPPLEAALRAALEAKGLRYVGLRGNPSAKVWVLGEAPGAEEDQAGLPFVGYSGKLLDQMLSEAGFKEADVCFTNPFKTRPPENDIDRISELNIPLNLFTDQFLEELRIYRPAILIGCGKTVTRFLCPETKPKVKTKNDEDKEGFGSWRGSLLTSKLLDWPHYVIPMYHPAFVLRNYAERETCVLILSKGYEEYTYIQTHQCIRPLPSRSLLVNPDLETTLNYLESCVKQSEATSIDIELLRRKVPYTISFSRNPLSAISISFWNYGSDSLVKIWRKMDEIFQTKFQIGQNYTQFDAHWLRALGFRVNASLILDTLIRHHVLWPGLRHRLEFQTMQYTREPFYKWEGKGWSPKDPIEQLMTYNAKDAAVTYEIYEEQEKEFNERL
jgi:uracil-DNA glycosylase family 4